MNASELAIKMLEWEEAQRKANELAAEIETAVTEIGKTQTVGNVRVTYSKGRGKYDYEQAWQYHGMKTDVDIEDYKKVTYDYTSACKDGKIVMDAFYHNTSGPSATIKLLD